MPVVIKYSLTYRELGAGSEPGVGTAAVQYFERKK
jgi:hypothetical protein